MFSWTLLFFLWSNGYWQLQSHYWAYTLRKPELKKTHVPQCSLQHCLQYLGHGSNPSHFHKANFCSFLSLVSLAQILAFVFCFICFNLCSMCFHHFLWIHNIFIGSLERLQQGLKFRYILTRNCQSIIQCSMCYRWIKEFDGLAQINYYSWGKYLKALFWLLNSFIMFYDW